LLEDIWTVVDNSLLLGEATTINNTAFDIVDPLYSIRLLLTAKYSLLTQDEFTDQLGKQSG